MTVRQEGDIYCTLKPPVPNLQVPSLHTLGQNDGSATQHACLQVTGVLATRETFMVSIYDYDKDAEDAEGAEMEAAAPKEMSPESAPGSPAVKRNLSGGVTVKSRPCQSASMHSTRSVVQWALPAWLLVAVLALVLAWERRRQLQALPQRGEISMAGFGRGMLGLSKASVLKQ